MQSEIIASWSTCGREVQPANIRALGIALMASCEANTRHLLRSLLCASLSVRREEARRLMNAPRVLSSKESKLNGPFKAVFSAALAHIADSKVHNAHAAPLNCD